MATVSARIKAIPADVFRVLADGWTYSHWMVGTSHMRAVEPAWPAVGSKLCHCVGAWPTSVRHHTEVKESKPDKRRLLKARGWPVGEAVGELVLTSEGDDTRVDIREEGTGGAGHLLRNPIGEKLIYRRNVESMARLAALVQRRTTPAEGSWGQQQHAIRDDEGVELDRTGGQQGPLDDLDWASSGKRAAHRERSSERPPRAWRRPLKSVRKPAVTFRTHG